MSIKVSGLSCRDLKLQLASRLNTWCYTPTLPYALLAVINLPFKYEAQTALFKDPVRTAQ